MAKTRFIGGFWGEESRGKKNFRKKVTLGGTGPLLKIGGFWGPTGPSRKINVLWI